MRNETFAYASDFTCLLLDSIGDKIGSVKGIILFGSAARGDFDKESDIDIFVNVSGNEKRIEQIVSSAVNQFEGKADKSWHLRSIRLPINCIVGDLDSKSWISLKREIISSGVTLFGKFVELPKGLGHYMLFSFRISKLSPKEKVRFIRQVYGYSSKKEKKTYSHEGLLSEVKGLKLNSGTVAVPTEIHQRFYDFIKKSGVVFTVKDVWM